MYNGKEFQPEFGLDWLDYGWRMYDPALIRFHTKDRYAEDFTEWSPYHYAKNNPILNIDIMGDSTYTYNVATGALNMISDVGGNEQQIVNFVDADGKAIIIGDKAATAIIDGKTVFVTEASDGFLISAYDPMEGLSVDYNSRSGYEYTCSDLVARHKLKETKLWGIVAGWESSGNAQPIAGDSSYDAYVKKWGTDKAFWHGIEGGYFSNLLPGANDILSNGQRALSKAAGGTKTFNPNFSNVKNPIKSSWNRFLHANKGSGKSIQQLSKEYNKLMKGQ